MTSELVADPQAHGGVAGLHGFAVEGEQVVDFEPHDHVSYVPVRIFASVYGLRATMKSAGKSSIRKAVKLDEPS